MPRGTWHSVLQEVLVQYVTLLTNPEGPAPSAPTLPRKEIIKRDTVAAWKEARDAAAASAAAADGDGGSGGGGGGSSSSSGDGDGGGDAAGDDAALEHGDENEATQPAAAKAAGGAARGRPPGKGGKGARRPS
jgi:hypothetical protein